MEEPQDLGAMVPRGTMEPSTVQQFHSFHPAIISSAISSARTRAKVASLGSKFRTI
jgi:hypothetical protein